MMGREGGIWRSTGSDATHVYDVDLSDPAHPRLADQTSWSGRQLSMRQYGDTVRLVTTLGLPSLKFVQPRPGRLSDHQAEQKNRAIVRDSSIQDWIPGLSCGEVYHPEKWSGAETVAVTTFRPGSLADASRVGGGRVRQRGLLLDRPALRHLHRLVGRADPAADGRHGQLGPVPVARDHRAPRCTPSRSTATPPAMWPRVSSTARSVTVGRSTSTTATSGSPSPGPRGRGQSLDNGVVVLDERDGRLVQVGELDGLGVGEQIQSVRWFDDLAVMVTFRQMDPLYTIDLSDPAHPRRLGELKIPGFSAYLHPIGDDRLLGLGSDATSQGAEPRRPGRGLRHRRPHPGPADRQGHLRPGELVRGGRGPARVHLAARRSTQRSPRCRTAPAASMVLLRVAATARSPPASCPRSAAGPRAHSPSAEVGSPWSVTRSRSSTSR